MKLLFILLSALIFSFTANAQLLGVIPMNKFVKGYYYDLNGQKVYGKIAPEASGRNVFSKGNYILFKSDSGSDKTKIRPDMITAFIIGVDSFTVSHGKDAQFLKVEIDATVKVFSISEFTNRTVTTPQAGGGMMMGGGIRGKSNLYFYGPDADHLSELKRKNYTTVLSEIMADQPEIAEKIRNKKYRFGDLKKLFADYREHR